MLYNFFLVLYLLGCLVGLCFVFKKAGVAWWKAMVPAYNIVVWIKICDKGWRWYIYFLIPAINIFIFLLMVVETAKVFHRYGFWEQTFAVVFPWIYLPVAGFNKWTYYDPSNEPPHKVSEARDWLDAIVFALVAAVIIRGNVLEFYKIPSSSMEKSLLTGDYLMVSKLAYGPRATMTPLSMPLVHNVMPLSGGQRESFLRWIELPYHRYPGLGHVERFDAVVFNYPDGDTVCTAFQSNYSYHDMLRDGVDVNAPRLVVDEYGTTVENHVRVRPVDKRENFIKRCIGLPGEELQIVNQQVLINGKPIDNPYECQHDYAVCFNSGINPARILEQMGVSHEAYSNACNYLPQTAPYYKIPLTQAMAHDLKGNPAVADIQPMVEPRDSLMGLRLFPHAAGYDWSVDNFGPVHIPAKDETIQLTLHNLPIYERVIAVYEGNELSVRDGQIFINGVRTDSYTFKMDYYWMMGDNRHGSADSRYWGFVPENHIAGKAKRVVFSVDPDHRKVRWNRIFRNASKKD